MAETVIDNNSGENANTGEVNTSAEKNNPSVEFDFYEDQLDNTKDAEAAKETTEIENKTVEENKEDKTEADDYKSADEKVEEGKNTEEKKEEKNTEDQTAKDEKGADQSAAGAAATETAEYKSEQETKQKISVEIYNDIAKKFGHDKPVETPEQLIEALIQAKVESTFDSDKQAQHLNALLDLTPEEKVRYELANNADKYGILTQKDLEDKIAKYTENNEIEEVAKKLDERINKDLQSLYTKIQEGEGKKLATIKEHAQKQEEATEKLTKAIDTYVPKELAGESEKSMKAIRADIREYVMSGKYYEQLAMELEAVIKNPEKVFENAIWVHPGVRSFMLGKSAKQSEGSGKSTFIKENLAGKAANIGSSTVATGKAQAYASDVNENELA